nr:gliding motility lipoprotein GldD [Cerina litoralis]
MKPGFTILLSTVFLLGCKDNVLPKPKAMLRLEYPDSGTAVQEMPDYKFEYNQQAKIKIKNDESLIVDYPKMRANIYITYKRVDGNLDKLLSDAQKLTYEHVVKADGIDPKDYVNKENKVYGTFYTIKGNAASPAQFYLTDSVSHFLTGSLYFSVKPNYDSVLPAAAYLEQDIRRIMETLRWK